MENRKYEILQKRGIKAKTTHANTLPMSRKSLTGQIWKPIFYAIYCNYRNNQKLKKKRLSGIDELKTTTPAFF